MFEEIATIGIAIAVPFSGASADLKQQAPSPIAIYSSNGGSNIYEPLIYLFDDGNKYSLMDQAIKSTENIYRNDSEKLLAIFKNLIEDKIIDFDEDCEYFDFLSNLRNSGEKYENFLHYAFLNRDVKVCSAISLFLSQKDYQFILAEEENFILNVVQFSELQAQSFALNAILNWDDISDLNILKSVKIANRYLQEDLEEFINQRN